MAPFAIAAQGLQVGGGITYGTFKMQQMKDFLEPSSGFYLPAKVVDNFPSNIGYTLWATVKVTPALSSGVAIGLNSTGGRASYGDYTGSYTNDMRVSGLSLAISNRYAVYKIHQMELSAELDAGAIINRMEVKTTIVADPAYTGIVERKAKSMNALVSPGFSATRFFNAFFVKAKVLYEFNFAGDLHWTNSVDVMNRTHENETVMNGNIPVTVQWDGIRLGLIIGYRFNHEGDEK